MREKSSSPRPSFPGFLFAAFFIAAISLAWWMNHRSSAANKPTDRHETAAAETASANVHASPQNSPAAQLEAHAGAAPVRETDSFRWTTGDGKETNILRRLAHNDIEFARMTEENSRIFRRQLVFHKHTVAAALEEARLTGEKLDHLTLPALDGQEVRIEISSSDLSPSRQQGTFAGHVAGRPDSLATFAFKGGREAFTIISPADGLYLQGDPYEPGQIIVKSIDPERYSAGVCGTP